MRLSSYLKIGCAGIFALGLLGECTTTFYDATTNEQLRRRYAAVHDEEARLERQVHLYERRIKCVEDPDECGPVRTIDVRIMGPFEIRTEEGR